MAYAVYEHVQHSAKILDNRVRRKDETISKNLQTYLKTHTDNEQVFGNLKKRTYIVCNLTQKVGFMLQK